MRKTLIALFVAAITLGGCSGYTNCTAGAQNAEQRRACAYRQATNQLEATKATLLSLLESAAYAEAKGFITEQQFREFHAKWQLASEAQNAAVTGLALAKQADSDPWGLLLSAGPSFEELLRIASALGVR